MTANLKLASARDGNRAELAAAIAETKAAESAAETARAALMRAQELAAAASLRLDDARVTVAEARDAQANQLLASIKSATYGAGCLDARGAHQGKPSCGRSCGGAIRIGDL